jgi:hypothetical protein
MKMSHIRQLSIPVVPLVLVLSISGCSREEAKLPSAKEEATMPSASTTDYREAALAFARSLGAREYAAAYSMTAQTYRVQNTAEQLQAAFEGIVPTDWGPVGPIEGGQTMEDWPGKQPADLGWVYVSIGGDVYSEAITVIVVSEDGQAKIREVEFGRP